MRLLAGMKMYGRFAWGLRRFLREPIRSLEGARAIVMQRMQERENNFLRLIDRGIFGNARSPYLPLLRAAGCEMGDIRNMIQTKGLESTLKALRGEGVYITFEEFKGREAIRRRGISFQASARDFDNPYLEQHYISESGGSTGAGTRVAHDLDHLAAQAPPLMITQHAHNVLDVPAALWRGPLPDGSGLNKILRHARFRRIPHTWFTFAAKDWTPPLRFRAVTLYFLLVTRALGAPVPWPRPVTLKNAGVVARWAVEMLEKHEACLIATPVSRALRVCLEAQKSGFDLTGTTFRVAGEPLTEAKIHGITTTGARCFTTYGFNEVGRIGMGCAKPRDCTDVHLLEDMCSMIPWPRKVPGSEISVPAFNFTTLLPSSPKILLNVESDDYGTLEIRSCGCPLEESGYAAHLRQIRSFSKLTGEGVTLVGSEMVRILEVVLPNRFGGSSIDYQLCEEEDGQGLTRLILRVSPSIGIPDEAEVMQTILSALERSSPEADSAGAIWRQAQSLRIERKEPLWTNRGKLMPLHLVKYLESGSQRDDLAQQPDH